MAGTRVWAFLAAVSVPRRPLGRLVALVGVR
jgi:hypothetical protein